MQTKEDFPHGNLKLNGYEIHQLKLPESWRTLIRNENWEKLDQEAQLALSPNGFLYRFLHQFLDFQHVEHILALRSAPHDEEGIWHDDGSRNMAFSLSLSEKPHEIEGGRLFIRAKSNPKKESSLGPLPFGQIGVFLTGHYGFDHRTEAVHKGQRLVLAGWCTI